MLYIALTIAGLAAIWYSVRLAKTAQKLMDDELL